jgi:hypothetical protein
MRGSPLAHLVIVFALLLLTAVPLIRLSGPASGASPGASGVGTGNAESAEGGAANAPSAATSVKVSLRFVHKPSAVALWADGKEAHRWDHPEQALEHEAKVLLPMPEHRLEFEVRAAWPQGTPPTMTEVTVEPDNLPTQVQNVWAEGSAEEFLTFSWN